MISALVLGVISVPFLVIKGEEIARARENEREEIQNKEWYEKADEYMDSGEYEDAIELLEKLPEDYEDSSYIIAYAEYCKGIEEKEEIEQLYRLTWDFPDEDEYDGKYAEKMQTAEAEIKIQYEEYTRQKEKEKREKIKKDTPYRGMEEKYINLTILGKAQQKKTGHYWRDTPGKRTQEIQYNYIWYGSHGEKKFMATCREGRVSSVVEFGSSASSNSTNRYTGDDKSKDMYDVYDYDDPEDFYYDHIDEFDDVQDAEDYWEESR